MTSLARASVLVVMGVSGSGKTTIGRALAKTLGWAFLDADDLHPPDNVEKMRRGVGLDEDDRAPWIEAVRDEVLAWRAAHRSAVLACSALKRPHRDRLRVDEGVEFVYLRTPPRVLAERLTERLTEREEHFAGPALLASQLRDLEEPSSDEALIVDASLPVDDVVARVEAALGSRPDA